MPVIDVLEGQHLAETPNLLGKLLLRFSTGYHDAPERQDVVQKLYTPCVALGQLTEVKVGTVSLGESCQRH